MVIRCLKISMFHFILNFLFLIEKMLNPVISFIIWNEKPIVWQELLIACDLTYLRDHHTTMARYPWGSATCTLAVHCKSCKMSTDFRVLKKVIVTKCVEWIWKHMDDLSSSVMLSFWVFRKTIEQLLYGLLGRRAKPKPGTSYSWVICLKLLD